MIYMEKPRKLTVTEAARRFADVVNRAHYRGETTVLVKGGVPVASITPAVPPAATTAADLAARWESLPRLDRTDADMLARELALARESLPPRPPAWD